MQAPSASDLATFCGMSAPPSDAVKHAQFQSCLDMAIEYVERHTGALDVRESGTAMARDAVLIIAKHEWTVRMGVSMRGGLGGNPEQVMPGPSGYLIPNRAASLIESLRWDDPASIGIG